MLTWLTILYLALPYFLFAWGWLWWPYAALLTAILLAALVIAWKKVRDRNGPQARAKLWIGGWEGVLLLVVTLMAFVPAGVGGIGFQRDDWRKHNSVLHDISMNSWPVVLEHNDDGSPRYFLTYYLAYYLPAGAVGRVFGVAAAQLALFCWTFVGLLLCARWVTTLVGGWAPIVWAAWFALSGMDVVFGAILGTSYGDWWAEYFQYSANYSLLIWVPQHALPGWLATALIVDELEQGGDLSLVGFAAALTALWSPFVTIGLAPVIAIAMLKGRLRTLWSLPNLLTGPAILLVSMLLLKSTEQDKIIHGFIWQFYPWQSVAIRWPLFCLAEFGLYAILIAPEVLRKRGSDERANLSREWFLTAILALLILPIYRLGQWNDLCMRASIPCLFLFWVVLLRTIVSGAMQLKSPRTIVLLACLLLASVFPAKNWGYQVIHSRPGLHYNGGTAVVSVLDLFPDLVPQYLGNSNSFFFRHLAPTAASSNPPSQSRP
jgi:hypothetical protein